MGGIVNRTRAARMTAGIAHRRRVVVAGAGVAGLACAIELAVEGLEVVLLEKEERIGGKMAGLRRAGLEYDGGPTVFTMRWVFDELLARAGTSLEAELAFSRAGVIARHGWQDGSLLDLHAGREESAAAIARFAGEAEADGYRRFCRDAGNIFNALRPSYIEASRPNPVQLAARMARADPLAPFRLKPFATLWSALGGYFRDPRLRQLYGRYATYCGSSPYQAPATLMLVAHVEQEGVWLVQGGMRALAAALERVALRLGVTIRKGVRVSAITRASDGFEIVTEEAGAVGAAAAVWCGDHAAIASGALGKGLVNGKPAPPAKRSLSAIVWTGSGRIEGREPAHHTVCFSRDYKSEFGTILEQRRLPSDPTVYLCAQDRGEGGAGGQERLYLLVNAPADGDSTHITRSEAARCLENAARTMTNCGFRLEAAQMEPTTPQDWNRLFPATGGALYGLATHGWTSSFARAGSRTRTPGLYLAGGSVHPGPGVPMAATSGRLAAAALVSDLRSRRLFHRVAIAGGMPTA